MRDAYSADISQFTAEFYFPLDLRSGSEEVITYVRTVAWKMQCYQENTTAFHGLSPDGLIQGCVTVCFGVFFSGVLRSNLQYIICFYSSLT